MGSRRPDPVIAAASGEAEQAMQRMKVPSGLELSLWAAEPMLANPVAFNFDEYGRILISETHRFGSSVLNITSYLPLVEPDLASRSLADRTALIERSFGPAGVKELSLESEIVRRLEDRDGDGRADFSAIYADNFRTPLDGIASGLVARRGKVWFTNIPSLWLLSGRERAETRTELSRGYGIRFNYTGHDLHGPVFGPDGKLYFSIGDRGANARALDGSTAVSLDTGAVFRCNPDGTRLEVVATGLRNPQGLLFTENGDLFTADNDSDQGDEERLAHIVEGGDYGWRVGYQFAPLGHAGPWNSEKLWRPRHDEQPAYLLPGVCNIEDGPSGIAYYPGTGLDERYGNAIFVTHFKGSAARSGIEMYKVETAGASYIATDSLPFVSSALPTDAKFGPDGRLYFSDWVEGWSKPRRGRIYAVGNPAAASDPLVQATRGLLTSDWQTRSSDELAHLLGHADARVRLEAQFTLAERGAISLPIFTRIATRPDASVIARRHALWGLGQLGLEHDDALTTVRALTSDADAELRAQAIRLLGDHRIADAADAMIGALDDSNDRVKFFAAQSLGKLRPATDRGGFASHATSALFAALRANDDHDVYLRHAFVMGLVGAGDVTALVAAIRDDSRAVRLGALLALRRLRRAEVAAFLTDRDPYIVREAAIAINDEPIAEALPALAALLEQAAVNTSSSVILRAINAHFRLGQPTNAYQLYLYALRAEVPAELRAEAIAQLALWTKPPARDRIVGVYRPLDTSTRAHDVAQAVLAKLVPELLVPGVPEGVQQAALEALPIITKTEPSGTLVSVIENQHLPAATRVGALKALDAFKSVRLTGALEIARQSDAPELRLAALPIAARMSPDVVLPILAALLERGNAEERAAAYRALGALRHPRAAELLAGQVKELIASRIDPAVEVELRDAVARRDDEPLRQLLAGFDARLAGGANALAPFRFALAGGDVRRGKRVFEHQPVMSCARCHRVGAEPGGEAGPNLAGIGAARSREFLLESIVKPNAHIAPGFDSVVLTLRSGGVAAGMVAAEDNAVIRLRDADGKITAIEKTDIVKRDDAPSAMPEIYGTLLTKSELRDVVAYLASLRSETNEASRERTPRALRGRVSVIPRSWRYGSESISPRESPPTRMPAGRFTGQPAAA